MRGRIVAGRGDSVERNGATRTVSGVMCAGTGKRCCAGCSSLVVSMAWDETAGCKRQCLHELCWRWMLQCLAFTDLTWVLGLQLGACRMGTGATLPLSG